MNTGIYQIRNLVNGKLYVGSAAGRGGLQERWRKHCETGRRGEHRNPHFQFAWDKYGEHAFMFEVLEKCQPTQCIAREQHYLDTVLFANCNDKRFKQLGYNICRKAASTLGIKLSDKTKAKMSAARIGKKYTEKSKAKMSKAQRGEKGSGAKLTNLRVLEIVELIKNGQNNQKIAQKYNVSIATISLLRHGKTWSHITGFTPNNWIQNKRPVTTTATRIKISKANKGRKHTAEACAKISRARRKINQMREDQ